MSFRLLPSRRPETLRSVWLSLVFLALVGGLIGAIGWATGMLGSPSPPAAFDAYVNLGPRAGTEALSRDLNQQHQPGTDLAPLLSRLQRAGFECRAEYRQTASHECSYHRSLPDRRVARIDLSIRNDGLRVQGITAVVQVAVR